MIFAIKPVILWTDALVYLLILAMFVFFYWAQRNQLMRAAVHQIINNRLATVSLLILLTYIFIGLLDSIHFRLALPSNGHANVHYSSTLTSALDSLLAPLGQQDETTYSAPFALNSFVKETSQQLDGYIMHYYPRLQYAGQEISSLQEQWFDIAERCGVGLSYAIVITFPLFILFVFWRASYHRQQFSTYAKNILLNHTSIPIRLYFLTIFIILLLIAISLKLSGNYHLLGTDKIGQDIFYLTLKSIRTGLIIGTLTTLIMLPFAVILGMTAGYFGKWIDDFIQYTYITLSSIPGVLLIAASILSLQVFIGNHPDLFPTLEERADIRLLALCMILGITSWTSLCRLLRAETLKLREVDYVQAAVALGVKQSKILFRHILPNVMHIILITVVLDFSGLVLAEAVLSYVGVGVDPTTISWGNMINSARLELAREPVVWWPLLAAFMSMFILVLSANLFADGVRDAFDPRIRS